jgi:chromosome segregation ATPase
LLISPDTYVCFHVCCCISYVDYETVRSKIDNILEEKKRLEDKVTFLEASKASVEDNADRILERDNTLARQHDRLKAEYKKQTMMMADLQNGADQLRQRLERVKSENERLARDARALKELNNRHEGRLFVKSKERLLQSNDKRGAIFGFRANENKDNGGKMPWRLY